MTTNETKTVEIRKNKNGWGIVFMVRSSRPYAVFIDGEPMVNSAGVIRTFGSREAAEKAAAKV